MSQYMEGNHKTALVGVAMPKYTRVKFNGTTTNNIPQVIPAGLSDKDVGVITRPAINVNDPIDYHVSNANGTCCMIASGAIARLAMVYGDANGTATATPNGNPIGLSLDAASGAGSVIEVQRLLGLSGGKLNTSAVASTAIANTTVETTFDNSSVTIPANSLNAGDRLRIFAQGIAPLTNSTDTLNVKLYLGATVLVATGALDVNNNDIFELSADVVIRTNGATGSFVASGWGFIGTPGTANTKPFYLASTAIDTTAAQVIKATASWSVANAGDSARLDIFNVDRV